MSLYICPDFSISEQGDLIMAKTIREWAFSGNDKVTVTFSDGSTQVMTTEQLAAYQKQQAKGVTKPQAQRSAQDDNPRKLSQDKGDFGNFDKI
jgi:phage portal protein BeeE